MTMTLSEDDLEPRDANRDRYRNATLVRLVRIPDNPSAASLADFKSGSQVAKTVRQSATMHATIQRLKHERNRGNTTNNSAIVKNNEMKTKYEKS